MFSDASSTCYGGCHSIEIGPLTGSGLECEASLRLYLEELKAVALVLSSSALKLAGHKVKWLTDNQNVVCLVVSSIYSLGGSTV